MQLALLETLRVCLCSVTPLSIRWCARSPHALIQHRHHKVGPMTWLYLVERVVPLEGKG